MDGLAERNRCVIVYVLVPVHCITDGHLPVVCPRLRGFDDPGRCSRENQSGIYRTLLYRTRNPVPHGRGVVAGASGPCPGSPPRPVSVTRAGGRVSGHGSGKSRIGSAAP